MRTRSRKTLFGPLNSYTTHTASFNASCGMATFVHEFEDLKSARKEAADHLRKMRRKGYGVSVLEKGCEWEITEPESAMLVPDDAGVLSLQEVEQDETEYDSEDDS